MHTAISKRHLYLAIVGFSVAVAWFTALFLMPGFAFDRLSAFGLISVWALLLGLLAFEVVSLRVFEISFVATLAYHFLSALTFALFVQGESYPYERFVTFAPLFYVWTFLALGSRKGLVVSLLFYAATLTLGAARFGPTRLTAAPLDAGALQSLRLFYASSVAYVSLLFAFAHYVDEHLRARAAAAAHYAFTDILTGLWNRRWLHEELHQRLDDTASSATPLALFFIDLDRFKLINDTLGHTAGDSLLQEVAQRLRSRTARTSALVRLGGDEFALLAPGVRDPSTARGLAETLLGAFHTPFTVGRRKRFIGASIGISLYPDHAATATDLVRRADQAMYSAKRKGRNQARFYTSDLDERTGTELELQTRLHGALDNGELELHYQPILNVEAGTATVAGVEALLRWRHPQRGLVLPDEFIPIAEASGLIVPIGRWALQQACRQATLWQAGGLQDLAISVNVSALQFAQDDFIDTVADALHASGLASSRLHLELTENVVVQAHAARNIQQLRALGVGILLDDFGTGYSSLSKLHQLPITGVKIDRAFVHRVTSYDAEGAHLARAIIGIANGLDMRLIAEGIESKTQAETLTQLGCTSMQGSHFSSAAPPSQLEPFLYETRRQRLREAAPGNSSRGTRSAALRWPQ